MIYSNFGSFVVYSIGLYFIMKAAKIVMRYFKQVSSKERQEVKQQRTTHKVDKRDIVEAEFEEITDSKKE